MDSLPEIAPKIPPTRILSLISLILDSTTGMVFVEAVLPACGVCHEEFRTQIPRFSQRTQRLAPALSTRAEFFDPNAMQLHTACSTVFFLPAFGT
jgi:hypothetical protein